MSGYLRAGELRGLVADRPDAAEFVALLDASDPDELLRVNDSTPAHAARQYAAIPELVAAASAAAAVTVVRYPGAIARVLFDGEGRVLAVRVSPRAAETR